METFKLLDKFVHEVELVQNQPTYEYLERTTDNFLREEFNELLKACKEKDEIEILDGAADVAYIALNIINKWAAMQGLNKEARVSLVQEVIEEVACSNLSKIAENGMVVFNSEGKVQKPKTYIAPDIKTIVDKVTNRQYEMFEL